MKKSYGVVYSAIATFVVASALHMVFSLIFGWAKNPFDDMHILFFIIGIPVFGLGVGGSFRADREAGIESVRTLYMVSSCWVFIATILLINWHYLAALVFLFLAFAHYVLAWEQKQLTKEKDPLGIRDKKNKKKKKGKDDGGYYMRLK